MSLSLTLYGHAMRIMADGVINNPPPQNPLSGTNGGDLLTGYDKYMALFICGAVGIACGAWAAWGGLSDRPNHKTKGLMGVLACVGGAVIVAIIVPVINTVYSMVS